MNRKNLQKSILGVVLALLLILCGCGARSSSAEKNRLVGKWYTENSQVSFETRAFNDSGFKDIRMLEFYENGKFIAWTRSDSGFGRWAAYPGTYAVCDDETVILYCIEDVAMKYQVSGNTLKLWYYADQAAKDYRGSELEITQFEKQ